jgi:preprotein translocase subunit YajC
MYYYLFLSSSEEVPMPGLLDGFLGMLPIILIFVFFAYFMLYRPQKRQERAINEMRSSLRVGDEIATTGGILGKIIQIKDEFIIIETGNNKTKMKIAKWGVRSVEHREDDDDDDDDEDDDEE